MNEARNKGLKDCVQYLGPRRLEDLVGEIEDCDVGIIPNQRNAFTDINTPTRIFEYLALGKPVIAPRTPGIQDYFGPNSLLFFESGNAVELAAQIEHVFFHPDDTMKPRAAARNLLGAHLVAGAKDFGRSCGGVLRGDKLQYIYRDCSRGNRCIAGRPPG